MKTPWRIANNDGRVSLVGADGEMFEIIVGQIKGRPPTRERVIEIAQQIMDGVNELADRGWKR